MRCEGSAKGRAATSRLALIAQVSLALMLLMLACGAGFMSFYLGVGGDHQVPNGPVEVSVFFLLPLLGVGAATLAFILTLRQRIGRHRGRGAIVALFCSALALAAFRGVFEIF